MRRIRPNRVLARAALGALPLLLATGCSGGDPVVKKEDVAEQASAQLEEMVGAAPDDFTCPEDLPAEVGAEIRCELTSGGLTYGVTVTTTEVDGDRAEFDVQVDETPK
ncbi:DUF4333 domain-containing protein [Streptomyces triticirhizae]|uniref:DUF4333 domain-containing protein n=1 Tax=Streptomyces triticirhizae TaxID=2483353 RepID=A0A3M2M4E3_9ACTN|nr:DUF4333 domain-containing protein [Streptomyces triticirhizae]RMI44644.1 DUF4333 domain-containing protein [Streptomyces triticirhizae]